MKISTSYWYNMGNATIKAVLDSGSKVSILSSKFLNTLLVYKTKNRTLDANGEELKFLGQVQQVNSTFQERLNLQLLYN